MRTRIATWIGVVALLSACGGSDEAAPTVGAPTPGPGATNGGAAGSSVTAPPTPVTSTPAPTAANPTPVTPAPVTPAMKPPMAMPTPVTPTPVTPTPVTPMPAADPNAPVKIAMDECGLKTKFIGDDYCIKPPPADKGFQMHIGPSNYDNPEPRYIMMPGDEITEQVPFTASNQEAVYYYWRQYRMRPGSHHLIINQGARRVGGSSNAAKDNPEAGNIAPENKGVGMPLPARAALSNSLHYFNFSDKPSIKEVWVNFWYRDKALVTEPTKEVFSMLGMGIAPGQHVAKHGACTISQPGRLLTIYGHVHAHTARFSVWRTRGGQKTLIHEAYDWEHPNVTEFSSTVKNPTLDPATRKDGGFSGVMDLAVGDVLDFECDITNNTSKTFLGANEAEDDEMCIMIGDTVGATVPTLCAGTDLPGKTPLAKE